MLLKLTSKRVRRHVDIKMCAVVGVGHYPARAVEFAFYILSRQAVFCPDLNGVQRKSAIPVADFPDFAVHAVDGIFTNERDHCSGLIRIVEKWREDASLISAEEPRGDLAELASIAEPFANAQIVRLA